MLYEQVVPCISEFRQAQVHTIVVLLSTSWGRMCICPQLTHGNYVQNMETSSIESLEKMLIYKSSLDIGSVIRKQEQILRLERKT